MIDKNQFKTLAAYNDRLQGFLQDGYHIIVTYNDDTLVMAKLRHHNGNRITLKLYVRQGRIVQYTNNVTILDQTLCKP